MISYRKTRQVLIEINPELEKRLPEKWETGINLSGIDLSGADLHGADLKHADLRDANLYGANLREADLRYANLRYANLSRADLYEAFLSKADLDGSDLYGAILHGAILRDCRMNWQSHDLIAERLRQAAGDRVDRRMVAGFVLVSPDWCWNELDQCALPLDLKEWALGEMRKWVKSGDIAPEWVVEE